MRRIISLFIAAIVLSASNAAAQVAYNQTYAISYVNEQHLMQMTNQLRLVDVNIEWPERLCGSDVPILKKELCRMLFGVESTSLRGSLDAFLAKCGKELTSMPDAQGIRKAYVYFKVSILAHRPGKFISFQVLNTVRDDKKLAPDLMKQYLLTYNILEDKLMRTKDILKRQYLNDGYDGMYIPLFIYDNFDEDIAFNTKKMPDEACLDDDGLIVNLFGTTKDEFGDNLVLIPNEDITFCYKSTVAKWLRKSEVKSYKSGDELKSGFSMVEYLPGDSTRVYESASTLPEYEGGTKAMMDDLVRWVEYPERELYKKVQGKVVVSIVVGHDGKTSSPIVISPVSPGLDRAAVKAVMALSKWKPGYIGSNPVNVRISIPVSFKMK